MPVAAQEPEQPCGRRLMTGDPTPESIGLLARGNPRGLLLQRDELSGWIGGMDRYSNSKGAERALWIEAYGGRSYTIDRVKHPEPIRIERLSVGMLGAIQPDRLASLFFKGDDDGLAARFLYGWPKGVVPKRPERVADQQAATAALDRLLRLSLASHGDAEGPLIVPLSDDAAARLEAWMRQQAEMEKGLAGIGLSWMGKTRGMILRLSLILSYLFWAGPDGRSDPEPARVEACFVDAAVKLVESYAWPMAKRCFGAAALAQHERDAVTLARWLVNQSPVPAVLNVRDLRRMANGPALQGDSDQLRIVLQELARAGWVQHAPARASGNGGRPRDDWQVNPRLSEALTATSRKAA
jgi:hypothetical protein